MSSELPEHAWIASSEFLLERLSTEGHSGIRRLEQTEVFWEQEHLAFENWMPLQGVQKKNLQPRMDLQLTLAEDWNYHRVESPKVPPLA